MYTTKKNGFDLNIMHAWGAVEFRIHLAPKYHGNSISAQSYDFCPPLAQLDTLDFTLSRVLILAINTIEYSGISAGWKKYGFAVADLAKSFDNLAA